MLNLTCIVHSPEVPAAIFWKHNGQVFFLLSYHIFTFLISLFMFFLNLQPPHLTLNYGSFAAARSRRRWNPDGGRRLFVSHQVVPLTRAHRHKAERRVPVQVRERNQVSLAPSFWFPFSPTQVVSTGGTSVLCL